MAAIVQTNELQVKRTTTETTVPDNDVARLMYYLDCVCTVIDCKDDANIQRFISYNNWHRLSNEEQKLLVALCYTISPDVLHNKVFFQSDELCVNFSNEFYEINYARSQFLVSESILIAGRTRQVNKIMVYKQEWMHRHYFGPIQRLASRLSNSTSSAPIYPRSNTTVRPITYTQPVVVQSSRSSKGKYICCGIFCLVLFVLPTIIGIIVGIINSKK